MAESGSIGPREEPPGAIAGDSEPPSGFRSPRRHGTVLQALLLALVVVSGLSVSAFLVTLQAFDHLSDLPIQATFDQLFAADERRVLIGRIFLGLSVVTGVGLIVWTRRLYRNLAPLGAKALRYSEGWAVGAFFVPFLNFWRPKAIINDIWRASDPQLPVDAGSEWKSSSRVDPVLDAWWAMYLASVVVYFVFVPKEPDVALRSFYLWGTAFFITEVIVATLLFLTATRLTQRQLARADAIIPSHRPGLDISHGGEDTTTANWRASAWRTAAVPVLVAAVTLVGFLVWTEPEPSDPTRFCEIFGDFGEIPFAMLFVAEAADGGNDEMFEQARRTLNQLLDEAAEVAPAEINSEVEVILTFFGASVQTMQEGGLGSNSTLDTEKLDAAFAAVEPWLATHC